MKQTEIGMIPDDWEVKNISKNCTIKARIGWQGLKSTEYLKYGNYLLITGTDFCNGFIEWKSCSYVTEWRFKQDKNIQIKDGDVLITKDGTIGKVAFIPQIPMEGTLNSGVFVVRAKDKKIIDEVFLSLIFKSFWFDAFLEQITSGSTIVHLYQKDFVKFNFPLPPTLAEQQKIAKAFSDVDNVISTLEKLITKKKNLKQGTMQQLLTGKKRLPGFASTVVEPGETTKFKQTEIGEIPEDWEVKTFEELFEMKAGGDVDKNHFSDSKTHLYKYKIFSNGLENEGLYGYTNLPKYEGDSITITGRGTVGVAMYRKDDFDAVIRLLVLSSKDKIKTDNRFITEQVNLYIKFPNESTGVPQLTVPQIKKINLYLPSKPEQTAIANVLSSMDKEIEALNTKLEKYRNLKTGMMQQLLTGKIRLV